MNFFYILKTTIIFKAHKLSTYALSYPNIRSHAIIHLGQQIQVTPKNTNGHGFPLKDGWCGDSNANYKLLCFWGNLQRASEILLG